MIEGPELEGLAVVEPESPPPPPPARRRPVAFWDRVKIVSVLALLWVVLVWSEMSSNPLLGLRDAVHEAWRAKWWIEALIALELVRQFHYLVSESWGRYHHFWTQRVFGGFERRSMRISDWNRYRMARAGRAIAAIVFIAIITGAIFHVAPVNALFELPDRIWDAMPLLLQLVFALLFAVLQFVGIFWYLSRGGTDVYFPEDIKTRFTDVWGQDSVLARVSESIVFLEDPESIESRGGYVPGGILLWGPPGTGKGQPVSGLVMTPTGPRRMGDLAPGDAVMGSDGRPTRIVEVHLLGDRDLFRVGFGDGSSLLVTADHLWQVSTRYGATKVLETKDLVGRLTESDGHARYWIPMVAPVDFAARELPLHPYLLGALLGDGTFRHQVGISSADLEILARVELLLPDGDGLVRKSRYDWSVIGGMTRTALKELGLFGHFSYEKWIPEDYLWAPRADRLDLLQGLMDTDGHIDRRGVVEYHTTSERLAEGVRSLVESFGGTCTTTTRATRYTHAGEVRRGRPVTIVRIALPPDVMPFKLERKVERHRPRTKYLPRRHVVSIVPEGREEARCIRVEADDHLYVADRYIVTHNTLMAEAVAGETGKPFVFVDPGAFTQMFMGVGILKVKSLFKKLRKLAVRYGGVIVFFDEADSLGNRGLMAPGGIFGGGGVRGMSPFASTPCHGTSYLGPDTHSLLLRAHLDANSAPDPQGQTRRERMMMMGGGGAGMGTLQALLTEMSGLKKPRGFMNRIVRRTLGMPPKLPPKYRILVMMATNMPQALDDALLRPGRIDRIYKVGYPSKAGRMRTYQGYFDKVSHCLTEAEIDKLATITPYATGATIKDLVNESLIMALRAGHAQITWEDVLRAKQLKDLGPPEDVEYIERERHAVAIHEACHAVAAYRSRQHLEIDIATIEKGGTYLGMVASIKPEDQFTSWRSEYESDVIVSLASLAGERLFFDGDSSSGVSGDLESATMIATLMEGYWGMGTTIASHGVTHQVGIGGGGRPGEGKKPDEKKLLEGSLGGRIEMKLAELLVQTERLLAENRREILAVAHALETFKTLTGDDVKAIIEGTRGPLVDGTVYVHPDFLPAVERYHTSVVEAHGGHTKVDVVLPPIDSWLPQRPLMAAGVVANGANGTDPAGHEGEAAPDH